MTPKERFAALVETMLARSEVTYGGDESQGARRSFGSTSLKAGGRIFAMLVNDRLVVKLPAKRVDELIERGDGDRFDPGHGRLQKEWLSVRSEAPDDWLALATESEALSLVPIGGAMSDADARTLDIRLRIESADELRALRGALLAARASELAEMRRRDARHSFGYGTASQRDSMSAEAGHAERRWMMLDRLIGALDESIPPIE
jgi:hypothetical protein